MVAFTVMAHLWIAIAGRRILHSNPVPFPSRCRREDVDVNRYGCLCFIVLWYALLMYFYCTCSFSKNKNREEEHHEKAQY